MTLAWLRAITQLKCKAVTGKDYYSPQEGVNATLKTKAWKVYTWSMNYAGFLKTDYTKIALI